MQGESDTAPLLALDLEPSTPRHARATRTHPRGPAYPPRPVGPAGSVQTCQHPDTYT